MANDSIALGYPKEIFRTLDGDRDGVLAYAELKQMKLLDGRGINFGNTSNSGMVRGYFVRKYADRLSADANETFDELDLDRNNLLTRVEAKRAKTFFRDDL